MGTALLNALAHCMCAVQCRKEKESMQSPAVVATQNEERREHWQEAVSRGGSQTHKTKQEVH